MTGTKRVERRTIAQWLAVTGASLGIVAGVLQATIGAQIPEWSGDKNSPVQLGILTVVLSLISLAGGLALGRSSSAARRLLSTSAVLLPGVLCFTTVGTLWYPSGALLIVAALFAVASGDVRESWLFLSTHWLAGVVSVTGLLQLMLALGTGVLWIAIIGAVGALAVVVAPWQASKSARMVLLVAGAVPFAVLSWWSLVSPLLAVLALGLGALITGRPTRRAPEGALQPRIALLQEGDR